MITVFDWSRRLALGGVAVVSFAIGGAASDGAGGTQPAARPVVELRLDAIGDGRPGVVVRGDDLRAVTGLGIRLEVEGTHSLHMWAIDSAGCGDETQLQRPVGVRR